MPKKKKGQQGWTDDGDDETDGDSSGKFTTDKFGNTITKAEAKQKEEAEKIRAEAKARRLAKAKEETTSSDNANSRPQWLLDYDKVKAKQQAGKKLSGKDKKLLKRGEARMEEDKALGIAYGDVDGGNQNGENDNALKELQRRLEGFSLSVVPTRSSAAADATDEANNNNSSSSSSKDVVVKGISISAPQKPLLVNADLVLSHGRRYGLIGANGRGKSTLLRFLAARRLPNIPTTMDILLVEQQEGASSSSSNQSSVLEEVLTADTQRIMLLKQEEELLVALENHNDDETAADTTNSSIETLVTKLQALGDQLEAVGSERAEAKARSILSGLGFTETMVDDSTQKLSGGWRMRVSLAKALFVAPKLLLLDEPTNHLDLDAVLWLDKYLTTEFPESSTVLTISHDRDFLDETCTDLVLLTDDGGLEYHKGGLDQLNKGAASRNAKRAKDYALQQKLLKEERAKHPSLKLDKLHTKIATKLGVPRLAEKPKEYKVHFYLRAPDDAKTSAGLSVDLRDVCFSYPQDDETKTNIETNKSKNAGSSFKGFANLNLCIDSNTRAAIVGANGSGKSTLLKLIAGKLRPTKGEVNFGRKLVIGYYDQHFSELQESSSSSKTSAVDYLMTNYATSLSNAQEARKWLGKFGLDSARHVMPLRDLSGGQKARVCFASIALSQPHLLILDEPTNHLDLESIAALIEGLEEYQGGVLAVSHDAWLVDALSRDAEGYDIPLWICKDSTVAIEKGGFPKYRRDLEAAAMAREKKAAAIAKQKALQKAKERREKLARLRKKK